MALRTERGGRRRCPGVRSVTGQADADPFIVPGTEEDPNQPLNPRPDNQRHHDDYFCGAGGCYEAAKQFVRVLPNLGGLASGRLVVVGGPAESGKTSLTNLCVYHLQLQAEADQILTVWDYSGTCQAATPIEERNQEVLSHLKIDLLMGKRDDSVRRLLESQQSLNQALHVLSIIHRQNGRKEYFAVLLPPLQSDKAAEEIEIYCRALSSLSGMVCFVEYRSTSPAALSGLSNRPIQLQLGYLTERDAHELVREWPGAPDRPDHRRPPVRPEALTAFFRIFAETEGRLNLSIGVLLAILRRIYRERGSGNPAVSRLDWIEFDELVRNLFAIGKLGITGQGSS